MIWPPLTNVSILYTSLALGWFTTTTYSTCNIWIYLNVYKISICLNNVLEHYLYTLSQTSMWCQNIVSKLVVQQCVHMKTNSNIDFFFLAIYFLTDGILWAMCCIAACVFSCEIQKEFIYGVKASLSTCSNWSLETW